MVSFWWLGTGFLWLLMTGKAKFVFQTYLQLSDMNYSRRTRPEEGCLLSEVKVPKASSLTTPIMAKSCTQGHDLIWH